MKTKTALAFVQAMFNIQARVFKCNILSTFKSTSYAQWRHCMVMLFSYQIKLGISKSKAVSKILSKKLYSSPDWSSQCIKKLREKISFYKHLHIRV